MKKIKLKKCKVCRAEFKPFSSVESWCSPQCGYKLSKQRQEAKAKRDAKEIRKDTRKRKEALKNKSDHLRELQSVINKYVRLTDKGKPCCSCDKPDDGTHQRHASHYRSVAACSALRFNLKNIHTSCQQCNTTKSGNLLEYRIRLVKRYGPEYVEWLESQNQTARYEVEYLKRFKKIFNKRIRMIEKRRIILT